jgi:hypothetical protein
MRHTPRSRVPRPVAAFAAAVVVLFAAAGCFHSKADAKADEKAANAITAEIQNTLAQRPDVEKVTVGYQDTLDNAGSVHADITVKPGTQFDPVIDQAVGLIWRSKLNPLDTIRIGVIDAGDRQRGTNRSVDPQQQKSELDSKFGPRPN